MKKIIIIALLFAWPLCMAAQLCPGGTFDFKVKFDTRISLENLSVFYAQNEGNMISNVSYSIDSDNDEVHIWGQHVICSRVPFPTLIFSVVTNRGKIETYTNYYLSTYLVSLDVELPQLMFSEKGSQNAVIFYDNSINMYAYSFTMPEVPFPHTMYKIKPN